MASLSHSKEMDLYKKANEIELANVFDNNMQNFLESIRFEFFWTYTGRILFVETKGWFLFYIVAMHRLALLLSYRLCSPPCLTWWVCQVWKLKSILLRKDVCFLLPWLRTQVISNNKINLNLLLRDNINTCTKINNFSPK